MQGAFNEQHSLENGLKQANLHTFFIVMFLYHAVYGTLLVFGYHCVRIVMFSVIVLSLFFLHEIHYYLSYQFVGTIAFDTCLCVCMLLFDVGTINFFVHAYSHNNS